MQAVPPSEPIDNAPCPSPRSPAKARRLSPSIIIATTGQEALEELEDLEIIFGAVSELGGLERCTSLRSLTLIDCGLRRISNLEPVGHSLVKMCLCDQGLKKMEGLCLPGLKELYLHQNKISKIEGLDGCPSLRRLWLFSNRIAMMEGLHHCGALRELWLHDNRISVVAGMQSLVHLQHLGLAGNPIVGVRHLSGLRGLPSLMELTLDDIHFGTCPVVTKEGYRHFVMCCLRQVRRLDGLEVMEADRAEVEHKYEQEALAYQDRLEEIERRRLGEIRQAEMARDGGAERGSEVKAEMMRALQGLEGLVREGRASISRERSRQEEVQSSNLLELESNLSELQRQYCKEVDKRVQAEEAKGKEEERLFAALEERTRLERDYAHLVAQQQSRVVEGIAVQELSDHSPDFQRLRMEVWGNQRTHSGQVELMNVLRACRLYNRRLCEAFLAGDAKTSPTVRLFLCVSGSQAIQATCSTGLSALGRPAVALFPDPRQAAAAAAAAASAAASVDTDAAAATATDKTGVVVLQGRGARESLSLSAPSEGSAAASAAAGRAGGEGGSGAQGVSYFVVPEQCFSLALPEFHMLCASGAVGDDRRALDGALSKLSSDNVLGPAPASDVLLQLEIKMEEQVKAYLERMQEDVTPAEASRLQATEGNMRWKAANVASLRAGADEQRAIQEALLGEGDSNTTR
eukprot:g1778.t1